MKRYLKISAIGIFLVVLVVGLALLRFWISSLGPPPLMSLDFLNGRAITANIEYDPRKSPFAVTAASGAPIYQYYSWVQYYSFKADFSDVCEAADTELLALGFRSRTRSKERYKYRIYMHDKATSNETVVIYGRRRFVTSPGAQLPQPSVADGWVTVKISRGRLPLWPPRYLLYRLKKLSQVATSR
ncbi:MAG: hypothetical protein ACYSTT_25090 [Planctomycetota bacterium]